MTVKVKKVLPSAIALWPKLSEADVYQPVDKQGRPSDAEKRRYIVNLKFNEEEQRQVDTWLKKCLADFGLEDGKLPWKRDKKSGELTLLVTSGEDCRPAAVDADKKQVPSSVEVGSGSKLKVYVTANPYTGFGGGISLHINSYQILDLKEKIENPFERENGYTSSASRVEYSRAPVRSGDDGDIPF
jgi:hypothetical protein